MEQKQSNNDNLIVKDYRETGQTIGMIGKITLSCNLGEISLNVFRDEQGIIKLTQQSMILTNIERRIVETHGTEKITKVVVDYIIKNFKHQENTDDKKFRYMLLDRLKNDCKYFLGYGNRQEKYLWAGNIQDHIAQMKNLYNSFVVDEKPEWLSMQDIEEYEKKMKGKINIMNQKEKINEALNRELRRESFENLKLGFLEEYLSQNMRCKECSIFETRSMKEESCYVINWRTQGDFTNDEEKQFFEAIEEVAKEILKDGYIAYVKVSLAICGYEYDDIVKIFKRKSSETEELVRFSLELKQEN